MLSSTHRRDARRLGLVYLHELLSAPKANLLALAQILSMQNEVGKYTRYLVYDSPVASGCILSACCDLGLCMRPLFVCA